MSLRGPHFLNGRIARDFITAIGVLVITILISILIGDRLSDSHLSSWGSWLSAFIAGIALAASSYAIVMQARQGESTSWNIALGRLGQIYDLAYQNPELAAILLERPDPVGQHPIYPDDLTLSPKVYVWLGSLFLAFEQVFVASQALSGESKRVWHLFLRNQLNKPSIRAAFIKDSVDAKDFHHDFWRFVRGMASSRRDGGYEDFVIQPRFFAKPDQIATASSDHPAIRFESFSSQHAPFWLSLYNDPDIKRQMYAAPTDSPESISNYLASRLVYTAFINDKPIGGFTITAEHDRIATFGVVLHHDFRGKGLSKLLISELEKVAKKQGFLTLRGDVYSDNSPCVKALHSNGFRTFIWLEKNLS